MKIENFSQSWRFFRYGEEEKAVLLDLPHDAMIEEERIPNIVAGDTSGYFPGGRYVYEKVFSVSPEELEGDVIVSFDGVYQKATVYLNGQKAGEQMQGYTNFQVKLTDWLKEKDNVLRVEVDNTQIPNSRWYTGSGIYREVSLYTGSRTHIAPYGIRVHTLALDPIMLEVRITTEEPGLTEEKEESRKPDVHCRILDSQGQEQSFELVQSRWEKQEYIMQIRMEEASVWKEESPVLYTLQAELQKEGISDCAEKRFGIRTLSWNPKQGLLVNGEVVKLRGACIHHDNGILGAREYRDVAFRKIRILKESGYNAVRTAHNEPSEVLLEACDSLGMYVMAEFTDVWRATKNDFDYSLYFDDWAQRDLEQMIKKCAGHPSVIMYSIGNEVYDTKSRECEATCAMLTDTIKSLDDTRPVTLGFNILGATSKPKEKPLPAPSHSADETVDPRRSGKASPLVSSKLMNTLTMYMPKMMERVTPKQLEENQGFLLDHLDMAGLNYGTHLYTLHEINQERMIVNTETFPSAIGRTWPDTVSHPGVVGDFMWTGWDYLGECGIGVVEYGRTPLRLNKPYPCISASIGSVNLVGEIEAQGYYSKTVYGQMDQPYIGVHPVDQAGKKVKKSNWRGTDAVNSWAWGQNYGASVQVEVYSQEPEVELIQNRSSLGRKKTSFCRAEFTVSYQAGSLEAVAYDQRGNETGRSYLASDDEAARLSLSVECEELSGGQVAYVFAEIVDSKGIRKVHKEADIRFEVTGSGRLLATGSGNPWAPHPYTGHVANTWHGSAAAVVQADQGEGIIEITASVQGMEPVQIQVQVNHTL